MDDMNLTIEEDEIHCLVGENGCGKSTLIKIISGFYDYDCGEVILNGENKKHLTPAESMKNGIQVIYQDFSLFPNMTVAENIMMYDAVASKKPFVNWETMRKRAEEMLKMLNIDLDLNRMVEDITVAEKQIVAICRAINQDARLIIMDEPTSTLTYKEIDTLLDIVRKLNQKGIAILFVSHKLDEVMSVAQRTTVMRNGRNVFSCEGADVSKEDLIYHMTGKRFSDQRYTYDGTDEPVVMEVKNLSSGKNFQNISFSLSRGEVLGITGLLGCGRSELAQALFGLQPIDSGTISVHGKECTIKSVSDAMKNKIGYLPEDRLTEGIHMDQKISDNAIICVIKQLCNKFNLLSKTKIRDRKETAINRIHIAGMSEEKLARALSGGNQQKVILIKWLETEPDIFILNCPTVGVDIGSKHEIHQVVVDLAEKREMSFVVISDDSAELLRLCNRIIIMHDGVFVRELDTKDLQLSDLENQIMKGA